MTEMEHLETKTSLKALNGVTGYDAHTSALHYHFSLKEMEFNFQWIAGSMSTGGCELGEAFYVAQMIEDADNNRAPTPENWQREWENMAKRKEAMAIKSHLKGHSVSAFEAYLLASNYYRAALISMLPYEKGNPESRNRKYFEVAAKYKECFREAAKRMNPPAQFFDVRICAKDGNGFGPVPMPCYFVKPDDSGKQRPTLMMVGGTETFMEELYVYIAPFALRRGYNFLTFDLPGQGVLPTHGQYFRHDTELQISTILDESLRRFPEINPNRIVAYGISNGGYFVPRAATVEKRIRALAVSNAVTDNYRMFQEMPFAKATREEIQAWEPFGHDVIAAVAYRWGTDIKGQVEATRDFQYDLSLITCPCLLLVSCGELSGEAERQQNDFMKLIPANRHHKMVISDEKMGAISHCLAENRSYMAQVLFDWFDEVLAEEGK